MLIRSYKMKGFTTKYYNSKRFLSRIADGFGRAVEFVPSKVSLDKKRKPILSDGFSFNGDAVKLGPYGYVVVEM